MPIKPFYSRRRSLGTGLQPSSDMEDSEVKAASRPRLASSTARRPSLSQFLFGGKSQNNLLSPNYPSRGTSQISLSSIGSNSIPKRRRSRPSIAIPIDSHRHSFGTETDSADDDEGFDDQINEQQSLAASVEAFLALRRKQQTQSSSKSQNKQQSKAVMRKVMRVVVLGGRKTGKTAFLEQLACYNDITTQPYVPTIEDTYQIQTQMDYDSRPKEVIIFHDTAGINDFGSPEIRRPHLQVADAFILVYSVIDHESFNKMDILKRHIEKQLTKDKKDIPICVIGTHSDVEARKVNSEFSNTWANKERVKLFEISATNRSSLVDIIHYLSGRYFHPIKESKFSLSRKLRPEKSQQILTDI